MKSEKLINKDVVLDGKPDIVIPRRASIKLATKPQIVVAIPIGCKPVSTVLECPMCTEAHKKDPKHPFQYEVSDGFRAPGLVPIHFMLQHMNWVPPLNVSMAYMVQTGMLSAQARQIMTMEALRMGAKYIFYVDDDTMIPPKGLYTMHNFMEQNPLIGALSGVYTTREHPEEPLIYKEHGAGCSWDFEMGETDTPEPIFGAGAGCLLARLEAVKAWMDANPGVPMWADERQIPDSADPQEDGEVPHRVMWGHDIRFCKNLNEINWPVYVDGRVMCGHYDIRTGHIHEVPKSAPGYRVNHNTKKYWDNLYNIEGPNHRTYPNLFQKIADNVEENNTVTELGCGNGILGTKLTAQKRVVYQGFDISETSVEFCKLRFLVADELDIRNIQPEQLRGTIIASEVIEHLSREDALELLGKIDKSGADKIILTCPDDRMGPDEWHEHEAQYSEESFTELLASGLGDSWDINIEHVEEQNTATYLLAVLKR